MSGPWLVVDVSYLSAQIFRNFAEPLRELIALPGGHIMKGAAEDMLGGDRSAFGNFAPGLSRLMTFVPR